MAEQFRRPQSEGEAQFGQVVLQQRNVGAAFSLGLYETPDVMGRDLAFRGSFLPPPRTIRMQDVSRGETIDFAREPVPSAPIGVELTADAEAVATWRTMLDDVGAWSAPLPGEGDPDEASLLSNPETQERYAVYWELSSPVRYPGRTLWSGRLGKRRPEYYFVLEQYGSIEATLLLIAIFFLVVNPANTVLQTWLCHRRALEECGEGNIKVCEYKHAITGLNLHAEGGCHIECFEPQRLTSAEERERHELLAEILRYSSDHWREVAEERFGEFSLERVMNSIRNALGMPKTEIAREPRRPWNPHFYAIFAQVHNTL